MGGGQLIKRLIEINLSSTSSRKAHLKDFELLIKASTRMSFTLNFNGIFMEWHLKLNHIKAQLKNTSFDWHSTKVLKALKALN